MPLNRTTLLAGVVLKLVPVNVTVVPIVPTAGEKLVNVGEPITIKLVALVRVTPLVSTVIGPVVEPKGTVVTIVVAFDEDMVAVTPLNFTTGLLKFVPEIAIVVPTIPLTGLNPERVGVGNTSKLEPLVMVTPFIVMEMGPSVAPAGTVVVMDVEVAAVTVAVVVLNFTALFAGVRLKFVPLIVTVAPTTPLEGEKPVMVGNASMTIFLLEPSEPTAPGDGSVRVAAFPDPSMMVPPLSESAVVLM